MSESQGVISEMGWLTHQLERGKVSFDHVQQAVASVMEKRLKKVAAQPHMEPDPRTEDALIRLSEAITKVGMGKVDVTAIQQLCYQIGHGVATGVLDADFFAHCGQGF